MSNDSHHSLTRREMLAASAGVALAALDGPAPLLAATPHPTAAARPAGIPVDAGRLKQSVCRWPYGSIPLPEFCKAIKAMGLTGIDLLQPAEWPVARDAGLVGAMGYPADRHPHDSARPGCRRRQCDHDVRQPGGDQ